MYFFAKQHFLSIISPLESCPTGDDPLTSGQENEVQLVKCVATSGTFVLVYNNLPSKQMYTTASEQDVKEALEASP